MSCQIYEADAWAAGAWQDIFADLVQGQLQQLFLALLARIVAMSRIHVEVSSGLRAQGLVRSPWEWSVSGFRVRVEVSRLRAKGGAHMKQG